MEETENAVRKSGKVDDGIKSASKTRKKPSKRHQNGQRQRGRKPYPVLTFEESQKIGHAIMEKASGGEVKRQTLLSELKLSDNQKTRELITNSGRYGITNGSYKAETLSLTPKGKEVFSNDPKTQPKARFELAINGNYLFKKLYDKYKGKKLPSLIIMQDDLDPDVKQSDRSQCVDIFIQNIKFIGLLNTIEGAEHIKDIAVPGELQSIFSNSPNNTSVLKETTKSTAEIDFNKICFFIAPIGSEGDEQRKHSDAVLSSYVEKALETVDKNIKVIRADKIEQAGMISKQIVEYIINSRLVVADLSYLNPNVFYELCLRHVTGKPIIHIKRKSDIIPFDVNNFKTINIDFGDHFAMLAELESVRSTISTYMRQALADGESTDNPILSFCSEFRFIKSE